jgi:hypothetical protein
LIVCCVPPRVVRLKRDHQIRSLVQHLKVAQDPRPPTMRLPVSRESTDLETQLPSDTSREAIRATRSTVKDRDFLVLTGKGAQPSKNIA